METERHKSLSFTTGCSVLCIPRDAARILAILPAPRPRESHGNQFESIDKPGTPIQLSISALIARHPFVIAIGRESDDCVPLRENRAISRASEADSRKRSVREKRQRGGGGEERELRAKVQEEQYIIS